MRRKSKLIETKTVLSSQQICAQVHFPSIDQNYVKREESFILPNATPNLITKSTSLYALQKPEDETELKKLEENLDIFEKLIE